MKEGVEVSCVSVNGCWELELEAVWMACGCDEKVVTKLVFEVSDFLWVTGRGCTGATGVPKMESKMEDARRLAGSMAQRPWLSATRFV